MRLCAREDIIFIEEPVPIIEMYSIRLFLLYLS